MSSWFNNDATSLRSFLADLIEIRQIETIAEVQSFCDNPRQYNNLYKQWLDNGGEFPEDDNDEEDDADDDEEEQES